MTAQRLDGKLLAQTLLHDLKKEISHLIEQPGLAVILVGQQDASALYVKRKREVCEQIGIRSLAYDLPETTTEDALIKLIHTLNEREEIDGILVQFPLPPTFNPQHIIEAIAPAKDVDGFHPYHIGRLAQRHPALRPCTPAGIMHLLQHYDLPLSGKHAVVIGASNIVGRPMALELLMANCTVTVCHRSTTALATHVAQADILVSAMGRRHVILSEWVKEDAIVVDVGINRDEAGHLCGDLDIETLKQKASWITPVPGGVGPMTIATLMANTVQAYKQRHAGYVY